MEGASRSSGEWTISSKKSSLDSVSDAEILSSISEHTGELKGALWLRQIWYNKETYGFRQTVKAEGLKHLSGKKVVVLAAGPGFKRFGTKDLQTVLESKPVVVACDGALPMLAGLGVKPDIVVSVDAHPVVANFYRRSKDILDGATAVLSTTIHKDVVEEAEAAGASVKWFQAFFKVAEHEKWYVPGVTSISGGGNVGTTCYILALSLLKPKSIGLMGIEFAWSDETPYNETQYYEELKRIVGERNVPDYFRRVLNERDGKTYIADPVYYSYLLRFQEIWDALPEDVRNKTFNLTRQGILDARGLKTISAEEFVAL